MSLESAIKAMSTTPTPAAPAPIQQQSLTKQEVTAATSEAETKASNGAQLNAAETIKESVVADAKSAEATDTKPAAAKPEETASAKFSALAKKEKAIVKRDQEIKAKEQAFAEREAKIAEREARIKQSEELWDTDVFKALEARGYSYQKLTDLVLEGKSVAPESQDPVVVAKKTIEQFKAEQKARDDERLANEKKAKEEAELKQKQELEQAWEAYNNEVNEFVKSNADDYELINTYSQQALIAQTVDEFYNANKKVLSVKEAADMVESYLESEAKKALATKKFGSSLKKDSGEPKAEAKKEAAPAAKTLTNSMQPTSASVLPPQSEQDRMRRAMAALERNK